MLQSGILSDAVRICSSASIHGRYLPRSRISPYLRVVLSRRPPVVGQQRGRCSGNRFQVLSASTQSITDLPANLKNIVGAFQMVPDPMARYKQLLYFATKLDPLPPEYHTEENKVKGCVSQVWMTAVMSDGLMNFQADSDSQLTKGLAALLVQGLSGCTPQEVLSIQPTFVELLGLKQSLTPSRNNGFLNMFKLMQKKTLELAAEDMKQKNEDERAPEGPPTTSSSVSTEGGNAASASNGMSVSDAIKKKLTEGLVPQSLKVINQSDQHAHHVAMHGVPKTGETHFRIEVVSDKFTGLALVKRHRVIYGLLQEEMSGPVHALSLDTKAPGELG